MLPPAIASVRTSSVFRKVRCPPTRAGRICGCPSRITEMSALVPPTSMKMPSETCSCISAPAMPAAGPESIVWIGRRATSSTVMTPPSDRMIISGAVMPACSTDRAVIVAVPTIFGRIAPLRTAVRVRVRSPYSEETSCPEVAHSPRARAASTIAASTEGSSTANASLATITSTPEACSASTARVTASAACAGSSMAHERVRGVQRLAGRERHRGHPRVAPRLPALAATSGPDDTDPGDVALEQRVGRLRRRVRDEHDVVRAGLQVAKHLLQAIDDPACHTFGRVVRRRYLELRDQDERVGVHGHDVRERPADVDPDAQTWRGHRNNHAPISSPPRHTSIIAGRVAIEMSSTRTPVYVATHTLCVLVGSQTFCTCTIDMMAASRA